MNSDLIQITDKGLFCSAGDFFIDPWKPVSHALITHAHSDHARPGSKHYLATHQSTSILRLRLGSDILVQSVDYGQKLNINGVKVSFHPAGHILGSAQIRLEHRGQVWCVSGDYKLAPDVTCADFEAVRCHSFISESTFGLPIFKWPDQKTVFEEIQRWWRLNQQKERISILFCYSLGKAQRVLAGIDHSIGPILTHGAVERIVQLYRSQGIRLPRTVHVPLCREKEKLRKALVIAPPSANGTPWMRRFGRNSTGFVSGWMRIRGLRRRHSVDRGFILSDHADWTELLEALNYTEADRVLVTHGYAAQLAKTLREKGTEAAVIETMFGQEPEDQEQEQH